MSKTYYKKTEIKCSAKQENTIKIMDNYYV